MNPPRRQVSDPIPPATTAAGEMERACARLPLIDLLARMAAREEAALTEFHRLMADRLFSMALRVLGDRESAAEALQDCLVRIWNTAGRFDPHKGDAFTWSAMILRGLCLDRLRRRRRELSGRERWENSTAPAGAESGGLEDLFFRETVSLVRRAMEALDPADRTCLETALFRPETTPEAAESLGVSPGTLKVRIHRALRRLRQLLGNEPLE